MGGFSTAYTTIYNVICPCIFAGHLQAEDEEVLARILGEFSGEELTGEHLEEAFLVENPGYTHGWKRKRDARVPVQKLVVPLSMATLQEAFTQNAELQLKVHNGLWPLWRPLQVSMICAQLS